MRTRVIAICDGTTKGTSIVKEPILTVQKIIANRSKNSIIDENGNIKVTDQKGLKWEFQLKSVN